MHEIGTTRHSITFHLKDLLKRDAQSVRDVAIWLETRAETNRDRANRSGSKRMMARLLAAKTLLSAAEGNLPALKEILERTEGKVADVVVSGSFQDLVLALEAGRQRLLTPQPAIEGEIINPPIVVNPEGSIPEDEHQEPDSTESTPSK